MNVTLPSDQLEWLEAQVAAGRFRSVDEALAVAVADLKAMHDDDLTWAKPYVEEARASVARGDVSSGEDFFKRLDAKLEALRSR
jgi:Arc/MetJ-type ribon-helix-helix transcriptional regulator